MSPLLRHTLAGVLLCALGLAAYGGSLHSGFVWDDNFQIVRNPFLHSDQPLTRVLTSDVWGYMRAGQVGMSNYYRPLQMLTYRILAESAGLTPVAFHAASLLLNFLAGFAAYLVFWQLTRQWGLALAAGTLFAVHPIHSEAVLWIAAATELGCALFYFLAFWLFLLAEESRFQEPEAKPRIPRKQRADAAALEKTRMLRRRWLRAASWTSFLLALLWKEMALTLPVVIAAFVFFAARGGSWPERLRHAAARSVPYWAVVVLYSALRVAVLGYFSTTQHAWRLTPVQFAVNVMVLLGQYWMKLLLPLGLNSFYVFHPVHSLWEGRALLAVAFVIAAAGLIAFGVRRAPLASFGAAWVFLTLAPVLNLQGVGANVFTERYLYIPSLGFLLLVATAGGALLRSLPRRASQGVALALVAMLSVAGIAQIRRRVADWRDDRSLFTSAVKLSPDAALIRSSLAQVLRDTDGDLNGAEQQYRLALVAATEQQDLQQVGNAYVGLAAIASHRGQYQLGLDYIAQGLARGSTLPSLHVGQGILLLQGGHVNEAREVLQQANQYFPYDEIALNALGVIAMIDKDYGRAIEYFQQAVRFAPTYADGFNNLGRASAEAGKPDESIASFRRAVELSPRNPQFLTNLGVALARAGHYDEARTQLQRALQISPSFPAAVASLQRLDQVQSRTP